MAKLSLDTFSPLPIVADDLSRAFTTLILSLKAGLNVQDSSSVTTSHSETPTETPNEVETQSKAPRTEENVTHLVDELSVALESAIGEIHSVNSETKVLSLNARIEAARAGQHGAAFGVVAEEMQSLSDKTQTIASAMASRTREKTSELMDLIDSSVRGSRLSNLARVNIDLIDRNLYERTCDVRWWANDVSLVEAASSSDPLIWTHASKRMGIILDAYTVYHDLVLCDSSGRVLANGRPEKYPIAGLNVANSAWFSEAMATQSGDEYGFQTAHASALLKDQQTVAYSAAIRNEDGGVTRKCGVLGILFDWLGLAQPILDQMPLPSYEEDSTEAFIVSQDQIILASRSGLNVGEKFQLPEFQRVQESDMGFYNASQNGMRLCVGHAKAPGFETYSTNWYSVVLQRSVDADGEASED